jgi:outer membrane protein insertion porin family
MRPKILLLLAGFVLFAAAPAAAQKFQPKSIQFKGDPEYSDQELMAAADLKMGAVLTSAEMGEHSKRLMDSGVFDSLTYKFDGQDFIFMLAPAAGLLPVRLDNLPLTPGKDLDAKLHDRFPLYHGKVPTEGGLLDDVRGALEEMLAAQGIKATVAAVPSGALGSKSVSAMAFAITAPPIRVGAIQLEGVSPEMQDKVKLVADHATGAPFDTGNTEKNLRHAFESFYTDEGYVTVKVHAGQSGSPIADSEAIDVPFRVTVEEGRKYRLGSIHLPTGELLDLADINKAAGIATNKLETAMSIKEGVTLRTALLVVTGKYTSKGYLDCIVTPHPQLDEATGVVNYTFDAQTGAGYTMGKLTVQNASDELRALMLAAWKMPAGAVFNQGALYDYYYGQGNTPLGRTFASASCKYELAKNSETRTVDVTLRLERKN